MNIKALPLIPLVYLQFLIAILGSCETGVLASSEGTMANWLFNVSTSGSAKVIVTVDNITDPTSLFLLPKTYQALIIDSHMSYDITSENGSSYDWLTVHDTDVDSLTFTFTWPDAAIPYDDWFYFAGQESLYVGYAESSGSIIIELPKDASQILIDEQEAQLINNAVTLRYSEKREIPHLRYRLPQQSPDDVFVSKASKHLNLRYHQVMAGERWINNTIELVEQNWEWLKGTINGTLDDVNVTFVPYGYNDLGTKKGGITYDGSRNIEIAATYQFGIGYEAWNTALLFHELTHAFTRWLEYLPHFYLESIAQEVSCDALRKINMKSSAETLQESDFSDAYEGMQADLLNYVWLWEWDDTIYNNRTITTAVYGIAAFLGDYMIHLGGYEAYNSLGDIFNRTEMELLSGTQKLARFIEYLSIAFDYDMAKVLNGPDLQLLISQWKEANDLRRQEYRIGAIGPFTLSLQSQISKLVENATQEYENRNYKLSIKKFQESEALFVTANRQRFLDIMLWFVGTLAIIKLLTTLKRKR